MFLVSWGRLFGNTKVINFYYKDMIRELNLLSKSYDFHLQKPNEYNIEYFNLFGGSFNGKQL